MSAYNTKKLVKFYRTFFFRLIKKSSLEVKYVNIDFNSIQKQEKKKTKKYGQHCT